LRRFGFGLDRMAIDMGRRHVGLVILAAEPERRLMFDVPFLAAWRVDRQAAEMAHAARGVEHADAHQFGDGAALGHDSHPQRCPVAIFVTVCRVKFWRLAITRPPAAISPWPATPSRPA